MVDSPLTEENHDTKHIIVSHSSHTPLIKTERICFAALHNVL